MNEVCLKKHPRLQLFCIVCSLEDDGSALSPLHHINCRNLILESADKLTNMSSRIQYTTHFTVFLQPIQRSNPAICFCYFNTEGLLHRTSLVCRCSVCVVISTSKPKIDVFQDLLHVIHFIIRTM